MRRAGPDKPFGALALTAVLGLLTPGLHAGTGHDQPTPGSSHLLRVLTLNAAHARGDGPNQLLVSESRHRSNVRAIADLLKSADADIVGLQEADGPSWWSGGFDHVATLAEEAGFRWRYRGDHARSWLFRYGTALLSRLPLSDSISGRFQPTPPSPRKGYVMSRIPWPFDTPDPASRPDAIDVVSVHLDFMSAGARARQLDTLGAELTGRRRPVIVLGDFNADWRTPDSPLPKMAAAAGLASYEPDSTSLATNGDDRIDWILISDELEFVSYRVLPDVVSDHLAVVADLAPNPGATRTPSAANASSAD